MKFLVDNQLPPAVAQYLRKRGFDSEHVLDVGFDKALDIEICRYAESKDRILIGKDEDFLYLAESAPRQIKASVASNLAIAGPERSLQPLNSIGR